MPITNKQCALAEVTVSEGSRKGMSFARLKGYAVVSGRVMLDVMPLPNHSHDILI